MTNRIGISFCLLLVAGCAVEITPPAPKPAVIKNGWTYGVMLKAEPQSTGDPVQGYETLLNGAYMSCGIPYKLWADSFMGDIVQTQLSGALGGAKDSKRIAGRIGKNADMPYFLNVFTTATGAEVINGNCLSCHADMFNGEFVLGMGNSTADFTSVDDASSANMPLDEDLLALVGLDEAERANMMMMANRAKTMTMANMRTVGMNPAEMFAVILSGHHDLETLAWSDKWLIPPTVFDEKGIEIKDPLVTSDPPPWWRVHKKNALFYNGMARGDHRGTMALATSICVDTVEQATAVDLLFRDIQAYVKTIRSPKYPFAINAALAGQGKVVFDETCAGCHGTYGATDTDDTYPNLLIPLNIIGTDPVVANAGVIHAPRMVEWYNKSFYGKVTRMTPGDPFPGYMPPPLDGVWATAPFLHNGSVPTIEALLNSSLRPKYWKRRDYDSRHFDQSALGWPYDVVKTSQAEAKPAQRKYIFDTTYWSQSNQGHTFGDDLSAEQRKAVLEYIKTL